MEPLRENEIANLVWSPTAAFYFPSLIRIGTVSGGSCFLHAIFSAFYIPYIEGRIGKVPLNCTDLITQMRTQLAQQISEQDLNLKSSILGQWQPDELELDQIKAYLKSAMPVDRRYFEYIQNKLDKDILILDSQLEDVLFLGDPNLVYLGSPRTVIILLRIDEHFEILGLPDTIPSPSKMEGFRNFRTCFEWLDPLPQSILARMKEKSIAISSNPNL
jgi:hypothetical protein